LPAVPTAGAAKNSTRDAKVANHTDYPYRLVLCAAGAVIDPENQSLLVEIFNTQKLRS
jgi:hypothetical protein